MKRSAEASAEVSDATADMSEPLVKKLKYVKDLSSDDEYTSDYITGHFVKQRKKHQAKREKLLAAKGRKCIPITYTTTSTVSATSTFAPIRTPTGLLHSTSITKPTPIAVSKPVPTTVSVSSPTRDDSLITKTILNPSSSSIFKPIPKQLDLSLLKKEAVMVAPLKKFKKHPVHDFSTAKRSRKMSSLDTLQLIRNAELKFLRITKNEDPLPVGNTPVESPPAKSLRNKEKPESPTFTFRMPIPLKDIDIHYLDSVEYFDTLRNIIPEKNEQKKKTVEIDIQTDDVIIQEADGNHLTCSGCSTNLIKDNPNEFVVKCQKCLQNELPPSTNVIEPKTGTDETKDTAISWVCNKCKISKDELNKEKEEEIEQQAAKNSVPKIPDVDIPKHITPAQKMTNDIVPSLIAGEWTCEVCNSFNDELRARCFCCEAHKPGTNFLLDEVNKALKKRLESTTEEDDSEELAIIPLPDPVLYKPIPILPIRVNTTVSAPQLTPPVSPTLQTVPDIVPTADSEKHNEVTPATEAQKIYTGMSMDEEPFPQTSLAKTPSPAPAVFSFGKSDETKEPQPSFQTPVNKVPAVFTFGKPAETTQTKPGFQSPQSKAPAVFTFGKLAETNELKPSFQPPTATVANTPGMFSFGKPAEATKAIPSFQPPTVSPTLFQFGNNNDTSNMFGQQTPSPFTFTMGNTTQNTQKQAANSPKYRNVIKKLSFGGSGQKMRNFPQVQNAQTPAMFEAPSPFGGAPMFSPPVQNNIMSTRVSSNTMMASPMQRSISFGNIAPVAPMPQPTSKPAAYNFGVNEPIHNFFSSGTAPNPGTVPGNRKIRRATRRMPR